MSYKTPQGRSFSNGKRGVTLFRHTRGSPISLVSLRISTATAAQGVQLNLKFGLLFSIQRALNGDRCNGFGFQAVARVKGIYHLA